MKSPSSSTSNSERGRKSRFFAKLCLFALAMGALSFLFCAFNYRMDPFQIYARDSSDPPQFSGNERWQNAGLINSYLAADPGYDAVIIGTSLSQNFVPSHVRATMGWGKVLKLCLAAGRPKERCAIFRKALRTGRVKHVIWEICQFYIANDPDESHPSYVFPDFLYDDDAFNDLKYLFNKTTAEFSLRKLLGRLQWQRDLDRLNFWMDPDLFAPFVTEDSLASLRATLATHAGPPLESYRFTYTPSFPSLERNLLDIIDAAPGVEFCVFFPPVTTIWYALLEPRERDRYLSMRRFLVERACARPNVRLFAFDTVAAITSELRNYKDLQHYSAEISARIIDHLRADEHRLTPRSIAAHEEAFVRAIRNVRVRPRGTRRGRGRASTPRPR